MGEGSQVLLHGKMRKRNQFWVSAHELRRPGRGAGAHGGAGAGAPGHLGHHPGHAAQAGLGGLPAVPPRGRAAARAPARGGGAGRPSRRRSPPPTFPTPRRTSGDARHRLAFEELFLLQLAVAGRRRAQGGRARAPRRSSARGELVDRWRWSLPFELTGDQRSAIDGDRRRPRGRAPMQRLLMGEVGSGKTVVALAAMLRAVENGAQAALMAPTETLAEQHLTARSTGCSAAASRWSCSRAPPPRRAGASCCPAGHRASSAGGGHPRADRGPGGVPATSPLCVVDEQHRFGVRQRAALDAKAPEGLRPARAAHDRHADPAHARAHRLRRPRGDRAARAARGPPAGGDPRGGRRPCAGARLRADPRGDRAGAAVLRGLPAGRGVRGAPGQGGHGGGRAAAGDRVPRPARRADPRPDEAGREAGGDARRSRPARPTCWWPPA